MAVTAALVLFAASASAELDTQYFEQNQIAQLGETNRVGVIEVTANNTTASNITAEVSYPFNTLLQPSEINSLSANESVNITFNASPAANTPPGTFERDVMISSENYSTQLSTSIAIPERNNWTVTPETVEQNLSLNSQGVLQEFKLEQIKNKQSETVETNLTGNLSAYLSAPSSVQFFRDNPSNFSVTYEIPEGLEKGFYNATLRVQAENRSKNISISTELKDDIAPEITTFEAPDAAATKTSRFRALVNENLNLSTVNGTVYKLETFNNTTEYREFSSFDFEEGNGVGVYTYDFEAEDLGQYRVDIYAEDTSNNSATESKKFEVKKLDALQVLDSNIGFGYVIRGQEKAKEFIRLNQSTPVKVRYSGVTPRNSSIKVGIKSTGEPAVRYFDSIGDELEIEDAGNYSVVIKGLPGSEGTSEPNIQISFETVENHVEVPDVAVQAILVGGYAQPENESYAGMDVELYYEDYVDGVPQTAVLHATKDAGSCVNHSEMSDGDCIPNLNLGKIQNQSATIQSLRSSNRLKTAGLAFMGVGWFLSLFFVVIKTRYSGFLNVMPSELVRRILKRRYDKMSMEEIEEQ